MAKSSKVPRTVAELLEALDQQLFLLRNSLHSLREDGAHLRTLAVGLRTLICKSSNKQGLLWRLTDVLHVSDEIPLECGASVDRNHPLSSGLALAVIPLWRPGHGLPGLTPGYYRLRNLIEEHEAIYVSAVQDVVYTHQLLIRAVADQMGAHEDDCLDHRLATLNSFLINEESVYVSILAFDAELTLQIGERVLDHAERTDLYRRAERAADHGDLSLVIRFSRKAHLVGWAPVLTFRSSISEVEICVAAGPQLAMFSLEKRGHRVADLTLPYPEGWGLHTDTVFALSYSSNHRQARTIVNGCANGDPVVCDLGWLSAAEIGPVERHEVSRDFIADEFALSYCRMLRPSECGKLLSMSPDLREMRQTKPQAGPFPD